MFFLFRNQSLFQGYCRVVIDVTFIKFLFTSGKLMVVTKFCSGGNLQKFLRKTKVSNNSESHDVHITSSINHRQLLKFAVDVASGMEHLSNQKV